MTADAAPRVSIGMPVYNGALHIEEAIESIRAQTFTEWELIISDNASTDDTEEICRRWARHDSRIRYERQEKNRGAAWNFNRVFGLARAVYFKWHAHDDVLAPIYLEQCVAVLEKSSQTVVLCFPQRIIMSYEGAVKGPDQVARWYEASPPYDRIGFVRSLLIPDRRFPELVFGLARTDVLQKTRLIGAYNYADLVTVTELKLLGAFRHIPAPLFLNRAHIGEPEYAARRTARGEAVWYDPNNKRQGRGATWVLLRERLAALHHVRVPSWSLPAYYVVVIVLHVFMRIMPIVAHWYERRLSQIWCLWSRASLSIVRSSGRGLVAYRAWALAAGLRRLDLRLILLAFTWPSERTRARLYRFAADRLECRMDRDADTALHQWMRDSNSERRLAATDVLKRRRAACL